MRIGSQYQVSEERGDYACSNEFGAFTPLQIYVMQARQGRVV
jgi:hypothetical protein